MTWARRLLTAGLVLWALPWTSCGCALGALALLSGGHVRRNGPVIEFWGGALDRLLRAVPLKGGAAAITLGHAVLGRDRRQLDRCHHHELVHVRQYERWGPLFVPLYLGCSAWLWWRGRHAYYENPFEIEAFRSVPEDPPANYN